ncbi:MAG: hypothetical protein J5736_01160 [Bacilli bacterium]|nr:hypothetical protein [Bacilli bacterium]
MSEIKGQLLGILLVVAVGASVGGILYTAFKTSANNVSSKITSDPTYSTAAVSVVTNSDLLI